MGVGPDVIAPTSMPQERHSGVEMATIPLATRNDGGPRSAHVTGGHAKLNTQRACRLEGSVHDSTAAQGEQIDALDTYGAPGLPEDARALVLERGDTALRDDAQP